MLTLRTPVLVLSGFLGSGKTTLLLRLLEEASLRGLKPGILMNELGKQDVDGNILKEHSSASLEKLLDGCICCSKKSEITGSLNLLLKKQPDMVIIELTGVANPEEIADALTEPALLGKLRLQHIVTLLDAEHSLEYNSIFASDKKLVHTLRRQIETADYVIVNKTDLVKPAQLSKLEKVIRKHNETAQIAYTTYSSLDLSPFLAGVSARTDAKQPAVKRPQAGKPVPMRQPAAQHEFQSHYHDHDPIEEVRSYSRVQTLTLPCSLTVTIHRGQLERFLSSWRDQLIRAKGYLFFKDTGQMYLMQHAGKRTNWESAAYAGEPYLVVIGINLDVQRFEQEWQRLTLSN
ncbi:CobW family GTP-binding protein [Paenibacillus solisilvae]|uniref:CobW family GTP-binding protein n=1 Tax=Paenibacillus solisilvae TaxID=2486751 RepID=A0ABW0VXT2_9BACL